MNLLNIMNKDYESEIKQTISDISDEYKGLTREQTCFIYSGIVYDSLRSKHIMARIISTKDLGLDYEHRFVLVKEKEWFYIIDLTFSQFFKEVPELFTKLLVDGYQKVDRETLKKYLNSITKEKVDTEVDMLFFK